MGLVRVIDVVNVARHGRAMKAWYREVQEWVGIAKGLQASFVQLREVELLLVLGLAGRGNEDGLGKRMVMLGRHCFFHFMSYELDQTDVCVFL